MARLPPPSRGRGRDRALVRHYGSSGERCSRQCWSLAPASRCSPLSGCASSRSRWRVPRRSPSPCSTAMTGCCAPTPRRRPLAAAGRAERGRPALPRHADRLRGQALLDATAASILRHRPCRVAARAPRPHRLRRLDADHAGGSPAGRRARAHHRRQDTPGAARAPARAQLSKKAILRLYLRLAPFGGNLEGVRAASLVYFGKEPRRLSVAEAALLVALPQSPELRRPDRFPEAARRARNRVLARRRAGVIPTDEAGARLGSACRPRGATSPCSPRISPTPRSSRTGRAVHRLTIDGGAGQLEQLPATTPMNWGAASPPLWSSSTRGPAR